jgi:group I intron endonuclease
MKGIYLIENLINGHRYVGQSINIEKRISYHKSKRFNENAQEYDYVLYKALRKYDWKDFKITILEEVENEEDLTAREEYWYNLLEPEYNMIKPGEAFKAKSKPVYQIDKQTLQIIKQYPSASEAARDLNLDPSSVCSVARGRNGTVGGYYWKYVKDYTNDWKPKQHIKKQTKPVLQIDATTLQSLLIYDSITEASEVNNIAKSLISASCSGRIVTAGGYIWTFIPKK